MATGSLFRSTNYRAASQAYCDRLPRAPSCLTLSYPLPCRSSSPPPVTSICHLHPTDQFLISQGPRSPVGTPGNWACEACPSRTVPLRVSPPEDWASRDPFLPHFEKGQGRGVHTQPSRSISTPRRPPNFTAMVGAFRRDRDRKGRDTGQEAANPCWAASARE